MMIGRVTQYNILRGFYKIIKKCITLSINSIPSDISLSSIEANIPNIKSISCNMNSVCNNNLKADFYVCVFSEYLISFFSSVISNIVFNCVFS